MPLGCAGLSVWLFYNNYFFAKYPLPVDGLRDQVAASSPDFIDHPKLLDYLERPEETEADSFFVVKHFRIVALLAGLVFAFGFGFTRVVYYIRDGDQRVAATIAQSTKKSDQTIKQVVGQVKKEINNTVRQVADTLRQGQQELADGLDSTNKTTAVLAGAVANNIRQSNLTNKKVDRVGASVERARRSSVFMVSPIAPTGSLPVQLPTDRVKAPPVQLESKPRRRKVSYEEERDSIINYASGREYLNQ